ncbi:hypothetical protein ACFL2V_06115 [Pseudomonadota bacterium]
MKYVVILSLLLLTSIAQAAEQQVAVLDAEFWVSPRHGEVILKHQEIANAVRQLIADPEAYLVLHHPESEFGELWGGELQAWLVALGVVSDRLELRSGYEGGEGIALIVVSNDPEPLELDMTLEMMLLEAENSDESMATEVEQLSTESHLREYAEQYKQHKTENESAAEEVLPGAGEVNELNDELEVPSQDEVE